MLHSAGIGPALAKLGRTRSRLVPSRPASAEFLRKECRNNHLLDQFSSRCAQRRVRWLFRGAQLRPQHAHICRRRRAARGNRARRRAVCRGCSLCVSRAPAKWRRLVVDTNIPQDAPWAVKPSPSMWRTPCLARARRHVARRRTWPRRSCCICAVIGACASRPRNMRLSCPGACASARKAGGGC